VPWNVIFSASHSFFQLCYISLGYVIARESSILKISKSNNSSELNNYVMGSLLKNPVPGGSAVLKIASYDSCLSKKSVRETPGTTRYVIHPESRKILAALPLSVHFYIPGFVFGACAWEWTGFHWVGGGAILGSAEDECLWL
jgi:hypothetical protein